MTSRRDRVVRMNFEPALSAACDDLIAELPRIPIGHWNESVFRFFIVRRFLELNPCTRCETEWNRIDLFFQDSSVSVLLEIKFYCTRTSANLPGSKQKRKGGPSTQNFGEFCKNIEKLRDCPSAAWCAVDAPPPRAFLTLAYIDAADNATRATFEAFYAIERLRNLAHVLDVKVVKRADAGDYSFTCILLEIDLNRYASPSR